MKRVLTFLLCVALIVGIGLACRNLHEVKPVESTTVTATVSQQTSQNSAQTEKATVVRVVDGDTLVTSNASGQEQKVRLIGVNTPESVSTSESKNCAEGKEASAYTKSVLTPGKTVYLEYDAGRTDKYGRTLAYVWLDNSTNTTSLNELSSHMFNAMLLAKGFANTMEIEPNVKYALSFELIKQQAQNNQVGFWSHEQNFVW